MLSMLKLLVATIILSSSLSANDLNKDVEHFLKKLYGSDKRIEHLDVKVTDRFDVKDLEDWDALAVDFSATVKVKGKTIKAKQKMIWFTDGQVVTQDLFSLKTGKNLRDAINPTVKKEFYKKENLIYGHVNAKHKVVLFSDPLCPFCKMFVPKAIKYMKKYPDRFAVYYFHLPLVRIHPASDTLTKAAIYVELQGKKDVVLKLYSVKVKAREKNVGKILKAFNKVMKTDVTKDDIKSKAVMKQLEDDNKAAEELMVNGTPTMFFDNVLDKSKSKYKLAK